MNISLEADFEKKLQNMKTNINVDPALITLAMDVFAKCSRMMTPRDAMEYTIAMIVVASRIT